MRVVRSKDRSIRTQMTRMLIIMSILFVLLCVFINFLMRSILLANAAEHAKTTDDKLENQLEFLYDKMDVYSMEIAEEEDVRSLMGLDYRQKTPHIFEVETMIAYYKFLAPEILDISMVNDEVHYSTRYSYEELDSLRTQSGERNFSWIGVKKSASVRSQQDAPALLFARQILSDGENIGTLLISLSLDSLLRDTVDEMNTRYLLADMDGVIYSFNGTGEEAQSIWSIWKGNVEKTSGTNAWEVTGRYLEKLDCYQISALNVRQIVQNLGKLNALVWGCVILAVVFFLLFFRLVNKEIVNPLEIFHNVIREIRSSGQRKLKEDVHLKGCTEIREIGTEFNGMMADIEQLNKRIFDSATDLYEMKVKKQEAELSYMRSQIDPHFLYNTLEVFRKMALDKDAPEIAQMAVDMGNIFRYSTKGEAEVKLSEEISIIKSYIRIQKTRFQGKIEVFYFLPEATLQVKVMKMLLQPLVENAIYHGLEPKAEKGNLYIGARLDGADLVITVKDDGVGISESRLGEIRGLLEQDVYDTSKHVGIINTQARIRLRYGRRYGLQIESVVQDGTTITMRIPAQEKGEETDV